MEIDFFNKSEIESSFNRIDAILGTNIFDIENKKNPLLKSAFIELLICLRILMYKTENYASRICLDEDVVKSDEIKDVTDVIKYVRDALCHLDAGNHYLEKGDIKAIFNIIYGRGSILTLFGYVQESNYPDDTCFFYGSQKIYLKRHILPVIEEAKSKLLPLL
ncbi:MAG: hypothetical protein WBP02_01615 [Gammaproteobacteria bacterium]|jgi:hypothetical protein